VALATQADVENALGRFLAEGEDITTLLEEASDLAAAYLGGYPEPVPGAVSRVVATMVVAVMEKPQATSADYSAGGYNATRQPFTVNVGNESQTTTGPWLTKSLRIRLRPYRMRPSQRAYTIDTVYVVEDASGDQEIPQPKTEVRSHAGYPGSCGFRCGGFCGCT
jgi:hypothetical protein